MISEIEISRFVSRLIFEEIEKGSKTMDWQFNEYAITLAKFASIRVFS